jgi:hypothetical protein
MGSEACVLAETSKQTDKQSEPKKMRAVALFIVVRDCRRHAIPVPPDFRGFFPVVTSLAVSVRNNWNKVDSEDWS